MTLVAFAVGAALVAAEPIPTPTEPLPAAPVAPVTGGVLTLDEAVRRALESHPDTAAAEARTDAAEARVRQVGATTNPQLDGQASAGLSGVEPDDFAGPNPVLRAGVGLSWLLTDFGRTSTRVRAARLAVDASATGVDVTKQALIIQVESAYFEAVARRRLVDVTKASVEAEERHVRDAERLVKVGVKPSFDVAQAKTRLAVARTQLARTEGDARLALARLAQAIGGGSVQGVALTPEWPGPEANEDAELGVLMTEAMSARPDVKSFELSRQSADVAIDVAQQGLNPSVALGADIGVQAQERFNDAGEEEFGLGAGWSATVALNWPFLDGGLTSAQVDEARANRRAVDAEYASLELNIRTDVESAQVAIASAKQQLEAANASAEIAKEALRLAEARYRQGLSSGVELADAQTNVVAVGADVVLAEWTLATARASLRASLGRGSRADR